MSRERVVILVLVVSVPALLYWVAWRSQVIRAPGEPGDPRVLEEEQRIGDEFAAAQALYATLRMDPIEAFSTIEKLDDAVGSLVEQDLKALVRAEHPAYRLDKLEALREDVIGMMYHRWMQPSFDNYDRFLTSRGYVLPETYAEIMDGRKESLRISYPVWVGEPFDPTLPPREMLRRIWAAAPPAPGTGEARRLEAASIDADGVEVAAGRYCITSDHYPALGGRLGEIGWYPASEFTIPRYWQPRAGWLHTRLQRGECIEHATVGIILHFENGLTLPYRFLAWYDTESERWWIYSVGMSNRDVNFGGASF